MSERSGCALRLVSAGAAAGTAGGLPVFAALVVVVACGGAPPPAKLPPRAPAATLPPGPEPLQSLLARVFREHGVSCGDGDVTWCEGRLVEAAREVVGEKWDFNITAGRTAKLIQVGTVGAPKVLSQFPPKACLQALEDKSRAEKPIRSSEDARQYRERIEATKRQLGAFRGLVDAPGVAATAQQIRDAIALFPIRGTGYYGHEAFLTSVPEPAPCIFVLLRSAAEYAPRAAAEKAAARAREDEEAKRERARRDRQQVLDRRFSPLEEECASQWSPTNPKCDSLPGLGDAERSQCRQRCAKASERAHATVFDQALNSCVETFVNKGTAKGCEVAAPAGWAGDAAELTANVVACSKACRERGPAARRERLASDRAGAAPRPRASARGDCNSGCIITGIQCAGHCADSDDACGDRCTSATRRCRAACP